MKVGDLVRNIHTDTLGVIISADIARTDWLVFFGDGKKMWATTRWLEVISESR